MRGYHKPIMIAGGLGNIRDEHVAKGRMGEGTRLVVLGGPAMLIGLGGGAASSMASGASHEDLDFASVQRDNAEIEHRCQEVIDRCWQLGERNPIRFIHDVGAGGLSNALPELVKDGGCGGRIALERSPAPTPACRRSRSGATRRRSATCWRWMPPISIASPRSASASAAPSRWSAKRPRSRISRSPTAATARSRSTCRCRCCSASRRACTASSRASRPRRVPLALGDVDIADAVERVLRLPAVAGKGFLVTIGDRSVTGQVSRDQMVGPWQVPVADAGITTTSFDTCAGEAMAMGERTPLALIDAAASARMAVGEALTNIASAPIARLADVKLSANWMAAAGHPGEDQALFDAVRAVGMELCPALGIVIPVGKDSMSMTTRWSEAGAAKAVTAPLSLIVSAFAPVTDVRLAVTPEIRRDESASQLVLVDLGRGRNRLGASALAQVYKQVGDSAPDLDDPALIGGFFAAVQRCIADGLLLAYHDRSDGGLFVTLCEMAFAGRAALDVDIAALGADALAALFSEELGAVLQVRDADLAAVQAHFAAAGLGGVRARARAPRARRRRVHPQRRSRGVPRIRAPRCTAPGPSSAFACRRCATTPTARARNTTRCSMPTIPASRRGSTYDPAERIEAPFIATGARPRVAVLREQGVNGQYEMAAAFDRAGFEAIDVHMSDVLSGALDLASVSGIAACGGFSYGDVLGAGGGWAKTVLFNERARTQFQRFFARGDTFTLGVCNGCQMMSGLRDIIPGSAHWPRFVRNASEQYEARVALVRVESSPSILLRGMEGSLIPVSVAHGEGQAEFLPGALAGLEGDARVALRYVDSRGNADAALPGEPERLGGGGGGGDHHGRPRDHHDAAPGTGVPHGAELLAPAGLGRGRGLDAPVPQRARLAGLRSRICCDPLLVAIIPRLRAPAHAGVSVSTHWIPVRAC